MRIIELAGSPWQLGRQHGQMLSPEIRFMHRVLLAYLVKVGLVVGVWPIYALLFFLTRRFRPFISPRLLEEMKGIAAGAQVRLFTILLFNVLDDIANNLPRCSGLAAGGRRTREGAYLAGRNLDYPLFIDDLINLQTLFVMEPHRGLPFASLAWPGYIGVCTGLNKAGVAVSQFSAMCRDVSFRGTPAALRFRQGLEAARSVSRMTEFLLAQKGTIGNNLLLVSASEAQVLELSASHGAVRSPEAGLITVTNHYQSAAMAPWHGRPPRRPPFCSLAPYYFSEAYSRSRDARLRELAGQKILQPEDIQAILADEHIANPGTVASVVFSPGERTLWVAQGQKAPVSQGPFQKITLW
uniref:Peptidase C45 hydrolase domain-containing protein n=1 Tax=Desulfobacca acetoxidans TaxID=60893 RepID=A0A7C5ENB3_9BACT